MMKNIIQRINFTILLRSLILLALFVFGFYFISVFSALEKHMRLMENIFKTELEQIYSLLEEEHQDIQNLTQRSELMTTHQKEIFQSLAQLKTMQESLSHLIDQQFIPLDEKLKALAQNPLETSQEQDIVTKHHFLPAQGYKIFGVQPYGVIVSTPDGSFIIARIGQKIGELGVVKMIAAHKIIVGQSVITDGMAAPQ